MFLKSLERTRCYIARAVRFLTEAIGGNGLMVAHLGVKPGGPGGPPLLYGGPPLWWNWLLKFWGFWWLELVELEKVDWAESSRVC